MRTFTFIIAVLAITMSVSAQNIPVSIGSDPSHFQNANLNIDVTDTMYLPSMTIDSCWKHPVYYYLPHAGAHHNGYCFGTNSFLDKEVAERFSITGTIISASVTDVFVLCEAKTPASSTSVTFKAYNAAPTSPYPPTGSVIQSSSPVSLSAFNTSGYTHFLFPTVASVGNNFYLSFTIPQDPDSALVYSSNAANSFCHTTDSTAWRLKHNDTWTSIWHTYNTNGLRSDMYIVPLVDVVVSDGGSYFFEGIRLEQNQPNPAGTSTNIQYALENAAKVSLEILDMMGKVVYTTDEGLQQAGKHNIAVNTEKLSKGTYFYILKADNHRMAKKMIIE